MKRLYQSFVFEMSLYYLFLIFTLPFVYAITYHVSFTEVYDLEWGAVSIFCYPSVLFLSAVRYGYQQMKKQPRKII